MRGAEPPPPAPRRAPVASDLWGCGPRLVPTVIKRRGFCPLYGVSRLLALFSAMCLLSVGAHADIIFRVPEVLVRHAAAPRPVGTGSTPVNASRSNESDPSERDKDLVDLRYEEYFVEHEVSTVDARKAAVGLNLDDARAPAGCGPCSRRELAYCETRVLADHCCCERRFLREPFPWLPHTCYVGPARCRPRAGDCARYARLRDCCCRTQLAARWKGILSSSSHAFPPTGPLLLALLVLVAGRLV